MERGLDLEVGALAGGGLEVDDRQPTLAVALEEVEPADEVPVEDLAGVLVDQRRCERLLDGDVPGST